MHKTIFAVRGEGRGRARKGLNNWPQLTGSQLTIESRIVQQRMNESYQTDERKMHEQCIVCSDVY